ncbi:MAG: polyprenyl synthetase family protein [Candidatus Magasanikbacteria bacterium]
MNSSVHDAWLVKFHAKINTALTSLGRQNPTMAPLVADAVAHGRKIRSVLALKYAIWSGLHTPEKADAMFSDLARVELLHSASCILDDIIDGDVIRRGMPSFHVRHGLSQAILASLAMVAISLRGYYTNIFMDMKVSDALQEMIVGEGWDTFLTRSLDVMPDDLLKRYLGKTSPSFALAHYIVAYHATRLSEDRWTNDIRTKRASEFGCLMGELYQTANDYYDTFEIPISVRGKSNGRGVLVTLSVPLCFLLAQDPSVKEIIGRRISRRDFHLLKERTIACGIKQETRNYLDQIKERINKEHSSVSWYPECRAILEEVDSRRFWSYKYTV